jgi:predicted nucleic acid-binding protein
VSAATALNVVEEATRHPGHQLWPLDQATLEGLEHIAPRVKGHRQWTDALLLWQAVKRGGTFVTFDSGVRELAAGGLKSHLLVLKSR